MSSRDRSRWHNIHFYGQLLGGFFQASSVTDANLIWILEDVLLDAAGHLTIKHRVSDRIVIPSNNCVVPGDYDISCDGKTGHEVDGRVLDPIFRDPNDPNDPNHVADEFLGWHFRQSVLANMRGAREPIFESDFPSETDKIATLRNELYSKERFEMEVELRLGPRAREEESKC